MLAPSACMASTVQLLAERPSIWTVQAPHWLVSQPTCVPVSARVSRRTSTRSALAGTSRLWCVPFTVSVICGMGRSISWPIVCRIDLVGRECRLGARVRVPVSVESSSQTGAPGPDNGAYVRTAAKLARRRAHANPRGRAGQSCSGERFTARARRAVRGWRASGHQCRRPCADECRAAPQASGPRQSAQRPGRDRHRNRQCRRRALRHRHRHA